MVLEESHTAAAALLLRLQALQELFKPHESLPALLEHAAALAADWFGAPRSAITLLADDGANVRLRVDWNRAQAALGLHSGWREACPPHEGNGHPRTPGVVVKPGREQQEFALRHEIRLRDRVLGYLHLGRREPAAGEPDRGLIEVFCAYLGCAIEQLQMRHTLASTYARVALRKRSKQEKAQADSLSAHVLSSVQNPEAVAKIIARSFYRDLRKAGFETKQILVVASEIIRKLNEALYRTQAKTGEE